MISLIIIFPILQMKYLFEALYCTHGLHNWLHIYQ